MKKTLLSILLCLVMAVGILPTAVMAEEEVDPRNPVVQFFIEKKVEKSENAAAPSAETFEFVLKDTANEEKLLSDYGITLLDELKIETDGVGVYRETVRAKIDVTKVTENDGWQAIIPTGSQTVSSFNKSFYITEKNDGEDGWEYSNAKYEVKFKRDFDPQGNPTTMTCGVYEIGNDVYGIAKFTNTYTKQAPATKTVELPFTVTVKQGGNVAPGKQTFELEAFGMGNSNANEYADVKVTASVETNGVKDYDGKLTITGPEDQVGEFTSEGFYVREKNTKAANWEYSDAVWYVNPNINEGFDIYPAELKTSDNGDFYDYDREKAAEKMSFVNTYTENKTVTPENPKTGDNSVMGLWIALAVVSGSAVVGATAYSRKKRA